MSDLRKAAQQALEALEWSWGGEPMGTMERDAITALRAALAQERSDVQPEQKPVAWRYDEATYRPDDLRGRQWHFTLFSTRKPYADEMVQNVTPLYTAPPQRKPLTKEEIDRICASLGFAAISPSEIVRAVERAHGIGETK